MITTTDPRKCEKFGIEIKNIYNMKCECYKNDLNSTTTAKNGCWNCIHYR